MVGRQAIAIVGGMALLLSGLVIALPVANAQSTVVVTIPVGAGTGPSAAPGFSPENVTVVIGVNNTVTWMNKDTSGTAPGTVHTVVSLGIPTGAQAFNSGIIEVGGNFTETFTVPGTYYYHCSIHSWMVGSVIVLAATSTSSTHTTPEFSTASIAITLFVVLAAMIIVAPRLRAPRAYPVPSRA